MKFTYLNLLKKTWESDFFGKEYYELFLEQSGTELLIEEELAKLVDGVSFDLIECNLDVSQIILAKILEEKNFKLIDSRITFITSLDTNSELYDYPNIYEEYSIDNALSSDVNDILGLTHKYLTHNKDFISRYKNTDYFEEKDASRYFETWIKYSLSKENTFVAVSRYQGKVVGFFIFEKKKDFQNKAMYKGILCAVEVQHQGRKLHLSMQSFLFQRFQEDEFYIDNTTQLSNYSVVKNHIRSSRKLNKMSLTFMLRNEKS